jgi:hypothetical protein
VELDGLLRKNLYYGWWRPGMKIRSITWPANNRQNLWVTGEHPDYPGDCSYFLIPFPNETIMVVQEVEV